MDYRIVIAAGAALFAGIGSASAAGAWDDVKAVCADAIAAEAGVDSAAYQARLEKARDGATKRLTVRLSGDAQSIVGECKVRRGEVTEVVIES